MIYASSYFLKIGPTFKCGNAFGFDLTALTHLCFSVALYMYILAI